MFNYGAFEREEVILFEVDVVGCEDFYFAHDAGDGRWVALIVYGCGVRSLRCVWWWGVRVCC